MTMTETETTVTEPTVGQLTEKLTRLENQLTSEKTTVATVERNIESAMKANDLAKVLSFSDERTTAKASVPTTEKAIKIAQSAIKSAEWAQNADAVATLNNEIRKATDEFMARYHSFGVDSVTLVRSDETGKTLVNPVEPIAAKSGRGGNSTGSRGSPMTVDGTTYDSASAANLAFFPDSGALNRASIESKLVNAGHSVS